MSFAKFWALQGMLQEGGSINTAGGDSDERL